MTQYLPIKRALISVADKEGIINFASDLLSLGIEIISTGGTCALLKEHGLPVIDVASITNFPEIMDGRIKTLHPKIHGGILGKRQIHAEIAREHQISWIDLVVVNLYPFKEASARADATFDEIIENIDIGGPTMIRASAKNMDYVTVVVSPDDYSSITDLIKKNNGLSSKERFMLAKKAFAYTAEYDVLIHNYFAKIVDSEKSTPPPQLIPLSKGINLRYGENPHQQAWSYHMTNTGTGILNAKQHQGKELSYNNLVDADAAFAAVKNFTNPACVIVKHASPCGVGLSSSIYDAFIKAKSADETSAFGGIIAFNHSCDEKTAQKITESFFEVVIAPEFSKEALELLVSKKNLRVLELKTDNSKNNINYKFINGGILIQETDNKLLQVDKLQVVTNAKPSSDDTQNLLFAWNVVKYVKSNAIVIAKNGQTIGIGGGQVSRIDATEIALKKAGKAAQNAVLASDAFFPFKDSIEQVAKAGVKAIIQPGGSIRDEEVIAACNANDIAMVFTGVRCFRH